MKLSKHIRRRAVKFVAVATLAFGFVVPAGAATPPSTGVQAADYSMISNIMKTKHDTVKNSISNVR